MKIKLASIDWLNQLTPVSLEFNDIYFSSENGLEESRYVFLQGNNLLARFCNSENTTLTIAETGFGTGLNFLLTSALFLQFRATHPNSPLKKLHFISFEKFPLALNDLIIAHKVWPEVAPMAARLQSRWQLQEINPSTLIFEEEGITLELWLGDVNEQLPILAPAIENRIDCWYLDGFAPSKNPDMWSTLLFDEMWESCRQGGSFATFTAAGFVRRGLQQAGFHVEKRLGFGKKREMLIGEKR